MTPPSTPQHALRPTPWFLYWIARLWMWVFGWTVTGGIPEGRRFVLIAAPHTSNWDLPFMLAASLTYRVRVNWIGKHTLFKPPWGAFMRFLGGIPIDRSAPQGMVGAAAQTIRDSPSMLLAVPPSGTRSKRDHWKSGFYWIAKEAGVPILCGYLDYGRRVADLGMSFHPTGDVAADMDRIRAYYDGIRGRFPENETDIRLRDEAPKEE